MEEMLNEQNNTGIDCGKDSPPMRAIYNDCDFSEEEEKWKVETGKQVRNHTAEETLEGEAEGDGNEVIRGKKSFDESKDFTDNESVYKNHSHAGETDSSTSVSSFAPVMSASLPAFSSSSSDPYPCHPAPPLEVKLFVGRIPRTFKESDIKPIFGEFGKVVAVSVIRDKNGSAHKGSAFVRMACLAQADAAVRALNNQKTLDDTLGPLQVKYATGEAEKLGISDAGAEAGLDQAKLFVGSIPKNMTENEIKDFFSCYGQIDEVYIMKDSANKTGKGCAFIKFAYKEQAVYAMKSLDKRHTFEGCTRHVEVRFAASRPQRKSAERQPASTAGVAPPAAPFIPPIMSSGGVMGGQPPSAMRVHCPPAPACPGLYVAPAPYAAPAQYSAPAPAQYSAPAAAQYSPPTTAQYSTPSPAQYSALSPAQYSTPSAPAQYAVPAPYASPASFSVPVAPTTYAASAIPAAPTAYGNTVSATPYASNPYAAGPAAPYAGAVAGAAASQYGFAQYSASPAAPPAPRQSVWKEYFNQQGRPYYHNESTNVTQWEKPPDFDYQMNVSSGVATAVCGQSFTAAPTAVAPTTNTYFPSTAYFPPTGNVAPTRQPTGTSSSSAAPDGGASGPPGANIFIFHVPPEWTKSDLLAAFGTFGNVINTHIATDKTSDSKTKGYAFVSYDKVQSAAAAVFHMNGFVWGSKKLKVSIKKGEEYAVQNFLGSGAAALLPATNSAIGGTLGATQADASAVVGAMTGTGAVGTAAGFGDAGTTAGGYAMFNGGTQLNAQIASADPASQYGLQQAGMAQYNLQAAAAQQYGSYGFGRYTPY